MCSVKQATGPPSLSTDSVGKEDTTVDTIESVQALLLEARVKAEVDGEDYQQPKPAGLSGQIAHMQDRRHAAQTDVQASVPERPQITVPPQTTASVERDAPAVDTAAAVPVVVNAQAAGPSESNTREEDESGMQSLHTEIEQLKMRNRELENEQLTNKQETQAKDRNLAAEPMLSDAVLEEPLALDDKLQVDSDTTPVFASVGSPASHSIACVDSLLTPVSLGPATRTLLHFAAPLLVHCSTLLHHYSHTLPLCCTTTRTLLHFAAPLLVHSSDSAAPLLVHCSTLLHHHSYTPQTVLHHYSYTAQSTSPC